MAVKARPVSGFFMVFIVIQILSAKGISVRRSVVLP